MPLRDDLLKPIPGDNPSGSNLRYAPIYAQIQEARREEDDTAQGVWARAAKTADYPLVIKLATKTLATETKDLQIAAWLTEALTYEEGIKGLQDGLNLIRGLLQNFWDTVHPELEDGDAEFRATPLAWVGTCLDRPIKNAPITQAGYGWFYFKQSRGVPSKRDAASDELAKRLRAEAVAEGKLTPEDFDGLVAATPKAFYQELNQQLLTLMETVDSLSAWCDERFGDVAPSFGGLRKSLEDVHETAHVLLGRKREQEPDPEPQQQVAAGQPPAAPEAAAMPVSFQPAAVPVSSGAEAQPEAYALAVEAARAGRVQEAASILSRRLAAASTGRERFTCKTALAEILVNAGRESVAFPTLQDLVVEIEERKLEAWEAPEIVARPLALYYRCLVKFNGSPEEGRRVHARICRLDPVQALALRR